MSFLAARKVRADLTWRRAFELAADSHEAAPRDGVRWQVINPSSLESPLLAR
jgi:hypothetical protein